LEIDGQSGRIVREENGSSSGSYGPFVLKTALQPIFGQSGDGRIILRGFEALLRLIRGSKSLPPSDFFSRVGSKEKLALDVLCRSLHLANASLEGAEAALLFLNINPSLYDQNRIVISQVDNLTRQVQESRFSPRQIVCEITEHRTSSSNLLTLLVETLRENGFKIAVDDFGADGSDSKRVALIQPDIIKFDAEWVIRLMGSEAGFASLKKTVSRFHQQGAAIVMEGLEKGWQVDLGWGAGADLLQGYALARPQIAPTDFSTLYAGGLTSG
jgi:EAL domain-containing protein (putative c-di-GMP-specific phosphodiesterase class I)